MVLAGAVPIQLQVPPALVLRSIRNPDSLSLRSSQSNWMRVADMALAVRLVGAAMGELSTGKLALTAQAAVMAPVV